MDIVLKLPIAVGMIIFIGLLFYSVIHDIIEGDRRLDMEMRKDLGKESYERITGKKY